MQRWGWGGGVHCATVSLHRNSGLARRHHPTSAALLMALQSLSAFTILIHFKWT